MRKKIVKRQLAHSLLLIAGLIFIGTIGYVMVEGWSAFDSLYMTIITITTVGYGEVHPLSNSGRVFTLFLIVGGVGTILYALNNAARILIEGELQDMVGRRKVEKKIKGLKDHYIVCGYGRMGKVICKELHEEGSQFVVIEKEQAGTDSEDNMLFIRGMQQGMKS